MCKFLAVKMQKIMIISGFWSFYCIFRVFSHSLIRPYLCNMKRNNRTAEMFGEHFKE